MDTSDEDDFSLILLAKEKLKNFFITKKYMIHLFVLNGPSYKINKYG